MTTTKTSTETTLVLSLTTTKATLSRCLTRGLDYDTLPEMPPLDNTVPHAPLRSPKLDADEFKLAIRNALRYFPAKWHATLAPEFIKELQEEGHIYMRRFTPTEYKMKAHPVECYPAKCQQAATIMLMIQNNLDPAVAQYPHELITYGGNGSVFSNWAQYHLVMKYLSEMSENQTLHMYSGHPMGLFPSSPDAPRVVVTNGMVIPNYSSKKDYDKLYAMGVSQYGQMTAGSYCYIGPQGIVHGTTLTILNAARKYLGSSDMAGKVYVSSGLGGMSGAQPKAGTIVGSIAVIAEVDRSALDKRHKQGWVQEVADDVKTAIARIKKARAAKESLSLAVHANIVALWEGLAAEPELLVELGSDQTSLHNPFNGGYYPVSLSFEEAKVMMTQDPTQFKELVYDSLRRQVTAINTLCARGMRFWDYGNSFLLNASRAGADIMAPNGKDFRYPSYVQEFMGDCFSLGFGPFRWVCASGQHEDLQSTDRIAEQVMLEALKTAPPRVAAQLEDNLLWIREAEKNQLVVGSEARILYADAAGRIAIAAAMNKAVEEGKLNGVVAISRDHHDVSGTDSPWRETSNITDGSKFTADMAVHNVIGDAFRGATWVAVHNGGGCGWGEVVNGGFGLVLDGSSAAERRLRSMLHFDVNNGIARRAWAGNSNANFSIKRAMETNPDLKVTVAEDCDADLLDTLCGTATGKRPATGGEAPAAKKQKLV